MDGNTLVSLVTLGLVVATLLLWWEARRVRVEAILVASAVPIDSGRESLLFSILLENAGSAVARDVRVRWSLHSATCSKDGDLRIPVYLPGRRQFIVPYRSEKTLGVLADDGTTVRVDVEWRDGRFGLHRTRMETTCETCRKDNVYSCALQSPTLTEALGQLRDTVEKIALGMPVQVARKEPFWGLGQIVRNLRRHRTRRRPS